MNLSGGITVILGAELGTCSDTLMATIRSDRQAVKTGVFHLTFNMITITVGLILFPWFIALIETLLGGADLEQKIAAAHMIFNKAGVLLFIPFVPIIERLFDRLIPNKNSGEKTILVLQGKTMKPA